MSPFDLVRASAGILLFGLAAVQDLRNRKVSDAIWGAAALVALAIMEMDLLTVGWDPLLQLALMAPFILFVDALWDRDEEAHPMGSVISSFLLYTGTGAALVVPGVLLWGGPSWEGYSLHLMAGAVVALGFILYAMGLFRGGADAKAFMALALLFPLQPRLGDLPLFAPPAGAETLERLFPFALVVLLDASLLMLFLPLLFLFRNAVRGDLVLPQALVGYRVSVRSPPAFVWWMEGVEGGRRVLRLMPRRDQAPSQEAAALATMGVEEAWATPQIPFIVSMLAGLVVALTLGNIFLGLLSLL